MENIGKTAKILEQKREALPDLRKQAKEAATRYAEAHKALEKKSKIDELQKELAWAHVRAKEQVCGFLMPVSATSFHFFTGNEEEERRSG